MLVNINMADLKIETRSNHCSNDYEKSFSYESKLKIFQKSHKYNKLFKCITCQKTINHAGNLRSQELTHTRVKNYKCNTF